MCIKIFLIIKILLAIAFRTPDEKDSLQLRRFVIFLRPSQSWVNILRQLRLTLDITIVGNLPASKSNFAFDILSILIGVNDTWHEKARQNGVEVPRYEQFYRMLLNWTLKELPEIKLVLLEPFVFPFGAVGEDWIEEIDQRREVVAGIAKDYGAVFVPLQSILNNALKVAPQEHWLADGVHPMPAGHQLIADAWIKAAAPLLN